MGFTSLSDMGFSSEKSKPFFDEPHEGQVEAHYSNQNPSGFWFDRSSPYICEREGVWYFTPEGEEKFSSFEEML